MTERPRLPHEGALLKVCIEAFDDEGRGRAVLDGDVDVAVRGASPGDEVEARVERVFKARRLVQCRVLRVLHEGPLRVPHICAHQAPCPACPLVDVIPSAQMALKRGRIEQALADRGLDVEVGDVLPSPDRPASRQKVKLVAGGRQGRLVFGLSAPWSHTLVAAEACALTRPALRTASRGIRQLLSDLDLSPDVVKALVLREFKEGVGAVLVVSAPLDDAILRALEAHCESGQVVSLAIRLDESAGNSLLGGDVVAQYGDALHSPLEGGPKASVDAFCQVDPAQAVRMYEMAAAFLCPAAPPDDDSAWFGDLYAGTGGFARALLDRGARDVVCVERAASALETLQQLPVQTLLGDVKDALAALSAKPTPAGLVLDPPKKGLGDLAPAIAALGARRLALASCDPDAMARDLEALLAAGYRVVSLTPIDFFFGTPGVEVLTLLERPS